jgi:catechol 2,3-dioxygenase-like lactoylglutathione lyase family enzyme
MSLEFHHLALRTSDVPGLAAFYRDMFDLIDARDLLPKAIWLGLAHDSMLMIEAREAGEPAPTPGSMEMFAMRVTPVLRQVIRQRAVDRGCLDGETEHTVYVRDPEGRRVGVSTFDLTGLQLVVGLTPG